MQGQVADRYLTAMIILGPTAGPIVLFCSIPFLTHLYPSQVPQ